MSYDIELRDPSTGDVVLAEKPHQVRGGTYAVGGTRELTFNITYNYSEHFRKVLGPEGIRTIYGMTAEDSIPVLLEAANQLGDDAHVDYWKSTEGNAKVALFGLIDLAQMAPPNSVWSGD